jgi:hypothetical protein
MNQTYVDHKMYEWQSSYAYSSIVGEFLHLPVGIISLLEMGNWYIEGAFHIDYTFSQSALSKCIDYEPNHNQNLYWYLYLVE